MKKTKIVIFFLACMVLFGCLGYLIIGNPIIFINNKNLENSITAIDNQTVQLNNVVPFEWDTLYTFGPYTPKEAIESTIDFKSKDIKENNHKWVQVLQSKSNAT